MNAQGSKLVVLAALAGNATIAVIKFIAAAYTGSSAMLAEAIHSVADTGNQGLLLYGTGRAARPPDIKHPFGHGRELYFWGFIVAILLFSLGAGAATYEGIQKILEPHPVSNVSISYIVLGASFCFESISGFIGFREFNRRRKDIPILIALRASKDPSLFTVLVEDTTALAGLLFAAVGITIAYFGFSIADGLASIAIGIALATAAAFLAYEIKSLLIGEAAGRYVVAGIRQIVDRHSAESGIVQQVNDFRTLQLGPAEILAAVSVDFEDKAKARDVEAFTAKLDADIRAGYPQVMWLFVDVRSGAHFERLYGDRLAEPKQQEPAA
jgi:cation diffusion facilitator family transporter